MKKVDYVVREIDKSEWEQAMQLVWDTFLIFEAPEYSKEGIQNFRNYIKDPLLKKKYLEGKFPAYGAYVDNIMVGFIGIRDDNHISLLFVDAAYHNNGIGSSLVRNVFYKMKTENSVTEMTVNAALYAAQFYHKMGFVDESKVLCADGIKFIPMRVKL